MKMMKFMAMMIAAVTMTFGFTSCGDDDDDPVIHAAEQMAGTYSGELSISVMGSESIDAATMVVTKVTDGTVSLTIPAAGSGAMSLPSLTVTNIPVTTEQVSSVDLVKGTLASASGTITVDGAEKSYSFTDITLIKNGTNIIITYTLQYGKMPMAMTCSFTGK